MSEFEENDENNEEFNFDEFENSEFEDDNDDEGDDEDVEFEQIEAEFRGAIPLELISKWKDAELNLRVNELNLSVLRTAVHVASNTWFWRFRSVGSKIKAVIKTYYALNNLIDNNNSIYSEGS